MRASCLHAPEGLTSLRQGYGGPPELQRRRKPLRSIEAHDARRRAGSQARRLAGSQAHTLAFDRVWAELDALGPGPALVAPPCDGRSAVASADAIGWLAPRHGFVLASAADAVPGLDAPIVHQHVALVVLRAADRERAIGWVKALARASPRRHLVFVHAGSWPAAASARVPRAEAVEDDRRLAHLLDAGRFEQADAWLAALDSEARLRGQRCRDGTLCLGVWLRVWQARYEEASHVCARVRSPGPRRTLAQVVAWASRQPAATLSGVSTAAWQRVGATMEMQQRLHLMRRTDTMHVLHAIPAVLDVVIGADDELAALRGAASWARAHAGAQRVAFVGGDDGRVVAAEGWGTVAIGDEERLQAVRVNELQRHERGPAVLVTAPIRYGGARVGGVIVAGPGDRTETLTEAAATLAALCAPALRSRLDALAGARQVPQLLPEMIGRSPAVTAVRDLVVRAAATPFPVLVEGESGTGKELAARALHRLSARRDRRFVALNCAALSDELVEAELFGHTRGAFTGALSPRAGLFEDAHGGTLFLDEVGELSPRAQAKLLRVLQEREVRRVGENTTRAVDVRVVAATNRGLAEACGRGEFRHDLLFRLAVVRIRLPPLRERPEDIATLAHAFWRRAAADVGKRAVLGADAIARLAAHGWPGNVRELQNVVSGLAVLAPMRGRVATRHVEQVLAEAGTLSRLPPMSLDRARWWCEQQTVAAALARHAGRRGPAARELGLTRQGLTKAIRRLGIHDPEIDAEGVA